MNKNEISKLSDFELDLGIAQMAGVKHKVSEINVGISNLPLNPMPKKILLKSGGFGVLSFVNDFSEFMPLALKHHIQFYVHAENHYTIDDGDIGENCFGELSVHIDRVQRVGCECLYKALLNLKESK